jgi:hypothetical protein
VDSRAALVLYRDDGEAYVVSTTPFGPVSQGVGAVQALQSASAVGGGDYPEAMERGMEAAMALDWRTGNMARVLFLVADAPPHNENLQRTLDAALAARRRGVRVYGLAASGVADTAEYLMRLLAVVTGARHLWLTDDSGIGGAHQMPKVQCYRVTRLDQLLRRVLESELRGSRVEVEAEAGQDQILREVGAQEHGICLVDLSASTGTTTTPGPEGTADAAGDAVAGAGEVGDLARAAGGSTDSSATSDSSKATHAVALSAPLVIGWPLVIALRLASSFSREL